MASIWMLIDDVPVDDFVPSIVVPFIRALGDFGIHANLESTTNHIYQNEGTLAYALFPGGELVFIFTTGPTHNPISGTVDSSRYMMADVKGIPNGFGITEDDVSSAIRQFHTGLIEREFYGGRPRITDGNSLGGTLTIDSFPKSTRTSKTQVSAPQPQVTKPSSMNVGAATAPLLHGQSVSRTGAAQPETSESDTAFRNKWPDHTPTDVGSATPQNKRGCYIATAVYGDYDHPQVQTLRQFRDESLSSSCTGRFVIRIYYKVSPLLIQRFGPCRWFSTGSRPVLDALAARLRASGFSDTDYTDPE